MNKKISFIMTCCVMLFMCTTHASAVVVQSIILKNGTVLNGYIQLQNANGYMTVSADSALICLSSTMVENFFESNYNEHELDNVWIKWAEENDAFKTLNGKRVLTLTDIKLKDGRNISKVRIMEKGEVVKCFQRQTELYTVKWNEVEAIRGYKRPKNALSGINRVHYTKDGRQIEGEFAEETDSTLSLYIADGMVHTLKIDDIVKYVLKPLNPTQDIFEQSPTLDILRLHNGTEIVGIVIEQNYIEDKDVSNYFLIKKQNGTIQSVNISDIAEVRKKENEGYKPLFDILLKNGEVMVNRNQVIYLMLAEKKGLFLFDGIKDIEKADKTVVNRDTHGTANIVLEYRDDAPMSSGHFKLVKVFNTVGKKQQYYFTYKSLLKPLLPVADATTSVNKTTKVEYNVKDAGYYALYDIEKNRAILIVVK